MLTHKNKKKVLLASILEKCRYLNYRSDVRDDERTRLVPIKGRTAEQIKTEYSTGYE